MRCDAASIYIEWIDIFHQQGSLPPPRNRIASVASGTPSRAHSHCKAMHMQTFAASTQTFLHNRDIAPSPSGHGLENCLGGKIETVTGGKKEASQNEQEIL
ncbi:hypothetical protein TWF694_006511 [Orbilia ellipsospora]|uniref:Uncharacterized protein n=1 Tax=Orbilia ellipsospora TaxID=2528407 RepID=A0AAV9XKP5_9PEZI